MKVNKTFWWVAMQTKHQMDKIWQLKCLSVLRFSILMKKLLLILCKTIELYFMIR